MPYPPYRSQAAFPSPVSINLEPNLSTSACLYPPYPPPQAELRPLSPNRTPLIPWEKLSYDYISQIAPGIGSQTSPTNLSTKAPLSGLTQAYHPRFNRRSAAHTRACQVSASPGPSGILYRTYHECFFIQPKRNLYKKTRP